MMRFFNSIINDVYNIRVLDIVDILIVAFAFYRIYMLVKETRAEQLVKGLTAVFIIAKLSGWMRLYTLNWILENSMTFGVLTFLIVFQPELRRMLEYIGRSNVLKKTFIDIQTEVVEKSVDEIINAVNSLSRQKIGALMIFERKTGLVEVIETGTLLNSDLSSELLINIFIPNTPLHDGAVIIKDDKIKAAACFLPLTDSQSVPKELGTRHRAAIGISEKSDCLALIVSEETGGISIAEKGDIKRYLDEETLRQILMNMYNVSSTGFIASWRNINGND